MQTKVPGTNKEYVLVLKSAFITNKTYLFADHERVQSMQTLADAEMDDTQLIKKHHIAIYLLFTHRNIDLDKNNELLSDALVDNSNQNFVQKVK